MDNPTTLFHIWVLLVIQDCTVERRFSWKIPTLVLIQRIAVQHYSTLWWEQLRWKLTFASMIMDWKTKRFRCSTCIKQHMVVIQQGNDSLQIRNGLSRTWIREIKVLIELPSCQMTFFEEPFDQTFSLPQQRKYYKRPATNRIEPNLLYSSMFSLSADRSWKNYKNDNNQSVAFFIFKKAHRQRESGMRRRHWNSRL